MPDSRAFVVKLKAALLKYEGSIPYLYQDSVGQVTIGVGHLVETEQDVIPLKLYRQTDDRPANDSEKKAAWQAVKKADRFYKGTKDNKTHIYGAKHYKSTSALYMKSEDIDRLTDQHIVEFHRYLASSFSKAKGYKTEFDDMPDNARLALYDMMFNMGPKRFPGPWPNLVASIKATNWKQAADRCNRPQLSHDRNAYVRGLFLSIDDDLTEADKNNFGYGMKCGFKMSGNPPPRDVQAEWKKRAKPGSAANIKKVLTATKGFDASARDRFLSREMIPPPTGDAIYTQVYAALRASDPKSTKADTLELMTAAICELAL